MKKIKRFLARHGIGDPLNILVYSSEEIKRGCHVVPSNRIPEMSVSTTLPKITYYPNKKGFRVELVHAVYSGEKKSIGRTGTVIGRSRKGEYRVRWDGNKVWSNNYPRRALRFLATLWKRYILKNFVALNAVELWVNTRKLIESEQLETGLPCAWGVWGSC